MLLRCAASLLHFPQQTQCASSAENKLKTIFAGLENAAKLKRAMDLINDGQLQIIPSVRPGTTKIDRWVRGCMRQSRHTYALNVLEPHHVVKQSTTGIH